MLKQTEIQVPFMNVISSSGILHLTVKDNAVLSDYLTLVLNSKLVRLQAERSSCGSIIQHWKQSGIENVSIPILPMSSQQKIAAKVRESFALRAESKRLLDLAKHAVEVAIEQGEEKAIGMCDPCPTQGGTAENSTEGRSRLCKGEVI